MSPDLCDEHHEDQKRYQRECMQRKRAEWDAAGMCTRCGRKRSKQGSHCARCKVQLGRVRGVKIDVKNSAIVVSRSEADGFQRTRYHGKMRRGAPSIDDQDDFERKIVETALRRYLDGSAYLKTDAAKALPALERESARVAALGHLDLVIRAGEDILERNRYGKRLAVEYARRAARLKSGPDGRKSGG